MKNHVKTAMNSLVKFIACNLLGFVFGFIAAFINYAIIRYNPTAHNALLWDVYIVICYFGCLRVAYWRWNKKRLKKPKGEL